VAVLALSASAFAASSGASPAVLIHRAASAIDSAAHAPDTNTPAEPGTEPVQQDPAKAAPAESSPEKEAPPRQEPAESPEPTSSQSPEASGDHSNTGSTDTEPASSPGPRGD
jgi:hypothetical protein